MLSQQVSSVMINKVGSVQQTVQNMLKCGIYFAYNYLYIHSVYKLYTQFLWCTLFVEPELMYTKCKQNVCMQNVSHISTNFCIYFVYKI